MTIRDGTTMAGVDMSADRGQQSASVGADTPIWLATLPSVNTSPHPTSNSADGLDGADGAGGADIVSDETAPQGGMFQARKIMDGGPDWWEGGADKVDPRGAALVK
jgi:S-formylglutathione hydrolase FrmB